MVIPRDEGAERAVLAAVLLSDAAIPRLVVDLRLTADAFYDRQLGAVWDAMVSLHTQGDRVDTVTVAGAVGGVSAGFVDELAAEAPSIVNVLAYARRVVEMAEWRAVQNAALSLNDAVQAKDKDARTAAEQQLVGARLATTDTYGPEALAQEVYRHLDGQRPKAWRTPYARIDEALGGGLHEGRVTLVGGWTSDGKALDVSTPVPTPDGWRTMGTLRAGDDVYGRDGKPVRVKWASPVCFGRPCYEIEFSCGAKIVADAEHLWTVENRASRRSAIAAACRARTSPYGRDQQHTRARAVTVTTAELAALTGTDKPAPSIPVAGPVDMAEATLPIDPYVLGAWLGDGTSRSAALTAHVDDAGHLASQFAAAHGHEWDIHMRPVERGRPHILKVVASIRSDMCRRGHVNQFDAHSHCRICRRDAGRGRDSWTVFSMQERLRQLGVLGDKHIPASYLRASVGQRLSLLQGIVDTDGHVKRSNGQAEVCCTRERLAADVLQLALSLGLRAIMREEDAALEGRVVGRRWRIFWASTLPVARLPRKAQRLRTSVTTKATHRYIVAVRPVPSRPVRCIAVDAPDELFLVGREYIATHNSVLVDQLLLYAAGQGAKVHLYINEMSPGSRARRIISMLSGVCLGDITNPERLSPDDYSLVVKALPDIPFGITQINDWSAQDVARHMRFQGWDVCAVDLIHLLPFHDERELAEASRVLNAAARTSGAHLLGVVHLNELRSTSDIPPAPTLRDIRGSGMLKNDADNVLFVYRDRTTDENDMAVRTDDATLMLEKCRDGYLTRLSLRFDGPHVRFVEKALVSV